MCLAEITPDEAELIRRELDVENERRRWHDGRGTAVLFEVVDRRAVNRMGVKEERCDCVLVLVLVVLQEQSRARVSMPPLWPAANKKAPRSGDFDPRNE